jgi:CRISPR-associated endonuclease Cas1
MEAILGEDDAAWAARNEHWSAQSGQRRGYSARRERRSEPLILCGHGVSLKVDKGTLLIRDGFTHWPQERVEHRLFKGARNLPPRIIMLDGSGSLSFDVMSWLSEQNIPLVRLDYQGDVVSVIGGSGFAMNPEKVQWQIDTRNDPQRRLEFCCGLIAAKLESSLKTLATVIPDSSACMVAVSRAEASLSRIRGGSIRTVDELRMIEATAAASYFNAWQGTPLIWRSKWKHPIPDAWQTIGARGSSGKGRSISNRNAKHPMNAMLNYAYGMLKSRVHIEAIAEGFDPRRGVMHHDREDRDAFAWVFDMIEPRRAEVDAALLKFASATPFIGADFVLRADGVCRVTPQLARRVAELVI